MSYFSQPLLLVVCQSFHSTILPVCTRLTFVVVELYSHVFLFVSYLVTLYHPLAIADLYLRSPVTIFMGIDNIIANLSFVSKCAVQHCSVFLCYG